MDEPLASLDDARKAEILPYIERLRDEARIPILYVSHAVAEVSRIANTVIVLENGRLAGRCQAEHLGRAPNTVNHSFSSARRRRCAGVQGELRFDLNGPT